MENKGLDVYTMFMDVTLATEKDREWTILDTILRHLRINKIKRYIKPDIVVCDLGCGQDAFLLKYFSSKIRQGFGFDMRVDNIQEGNLSVGSLRLDSKIPLEAEVVDAVVILAALEHFQQEQEILKEARRVLKQSGLLLITVPTYFNKPILKFLAYIRFLSPVEIRDHKRYYSKSELVEKLEEAGFDANEIEAKYWQFGLNLFIKAKK